jgi:hypothetical protein
MMPYQQYPVITPSHATQSLVAKLAFQKAAEISGVASKDLQGNKSRRSTRSKKKTNNMEENSKEERMAQDHN